MTVCHASKKTSTVFQCTLLERPFSNLVIQLTGIKICHSHNSTSIIKYLDRGQAFGLTERMLVNTQASHIELSEFESKFHSQ